MNPRNTRLLVALAAGLFAFIWFFERHWGAPVAVDRHVLPGFRPELVRSIQVQSAGQPAISAERTNGGWQLVQPLPYPGKALAIEELLKRLASLAYDTRIPAKELKDQPKAGAEYGIDPPLFAITFDQGGEPTRLNFGRLTPAGDEVYAQVEGRPEIDVVGTDMLKVVPGPAYDWRDTALVNLNDAGVDRLSITNGGKALELTRDPVTKLWRMTFPLKNARADDQRINELLYQLQQAQVTRFEPPDARTRLDAYGLQPPAWTLALFQGTNTVAAVQFGGSPTNDSTQVYARLAGRETVVQVPREWLEPWRAENSRFRERRLAGLTSVDLDTVEVHAPEESLTLQKQTNGLWRILPPDWPADNGLVQSLIAALARLEVTNFEGQFALDSQTTNDFAKRGLLDPARRYVLKKSAALPSGGLTNQVVAELDFGATNGDIVFARRGDLDESTVYAVRLADLAPLAATSLGLRERRVWSFSPEDVGTLTITEEGRSVRLHHAGPNSWPLDSASTNIYNSGAVEMAVDELGGLVTRKWLGWGEPLRTRYGFTEKSIRIAVGPRPAPGTDTAPSAVLEISLAPDQTAAYGAVRIDGQPWIFEFPGGDVLPQLDSYLNLHLGLKPQ